MIERSNTELSLRRQCWLLSVSRTGLSYQPVPVDEQTLRIMRRLDEWYVEHPDLGHRRLVVRRRGDRRRRQRDLIYPNPVYLVSAFSICLEGW